MIWNSYAGLIAKSPCCMKALYWPKATLTTSPQTRLSSMFIWGVRMLNVSNLSLKYGQSQILFDVTLQAEVGQITAVMGNNGVGKTSLLKAISGRHPISAGSVQIDGKAVQLTSAYH